MTNNPTIYRGQIWLVDFDPTKGQEIQKRRPAVVMSIQAAWRYKLHIVVPITSWQEKFTQDFWMVRIGASSANGLDKESAANAFQIKSVSEERFAHTIGTLSEDQVDEIAAAIALCIGFNPS